MLTPDQISEIHRLHWVEKWSLRKIAQHLSIGRRTMPSISSLSSGGNRAASAPASSIPSNLP